MSLRSTKVALPLLLILTWCFIEARAQSEADEKNRKPSAMVELAASVMNRELTTIHYDKFKLSDHAGKILVVNLFASWCAPCRLSLADLIELKRDYTAHSIEVIGVVWNKNDPDVEKVREFARERNLNFQVVWDEDDFGESLVKAVNGRSIIPQTFIIDKQGRIRKHFVGFSPLSTPRLLREALDQTGRN